MEKLLGLIKSQNQKHAQSEGQEAANQVTPSIDQLIVNLK